MTFPGSVVLVTGASRGLGLSLAQTFFRRGCSVAVNHLHTPVAKEEVAGGISDRCLIIRADVRRADEVDAMLDRIRGVFGRLDTVINNAGISRDNLLLRQTEAEWDDVTRTNLTGCFHVIRAAAPLMAASGGGHILNIASYAGAKGKAGQAAYSASKAGLIGLTRSAGRELASLNIRVNAIIPPYMMTDMGAAAPKAADQAKTESLLHEPAGTERVAESIAAFSELDYITGQCISLDSRIL